MLRLPVIRLSLCLAFALAMAHPQPVFSQTPDFPWPDPKTYPRVLLNVTPAIEEYMNTHPEWFAHEFLAASLVIDHVPYGHTAQAAQDFFALREKLKQDSMYVGTYVSGTTVIPELALSEYPSNAVSMDDMPPEAKYLGPWMREPQQNVVDLRDTPTRDALHKVIRNIWAHHPTPMRYVDNAAIHPAVAHLQSWADYCRNMHELGMIADRMHSHVMFNVFVRPWELSEGETQQLIGAVGAGNAIAIPLPWSKKIKNDKTANAWAIYRYRQLLDHGIAVVVVPSDEASTDDLIAWVSTWRRPSDRLYFGIPYWTAPPWVDTRN